MPYRFRERGLLKEFQVKVLPRSSFATPGIGNHVMWCAL